MSPLNSGPLTSQIVWGLIAGCAILYIGGKISKFGGFLYEASREANQHNKRIEFGSMIAAVLAVLISIIALGVALYGRDDLDARITNLEQATSAAKPSAPPTVKP